MATAGTSQISATLNQIYGENINRKFVLKGSKVLIGRAFSADIRLECPSVSRRHCILNYTDEGWMIKDNHSQNGTWISGQKLMPDESRLLQCGDIIFLGPPTELPQAFCYDIKYSFEDQLDSPVQQETNHLSEEIKEVNGEIRETKYLCDKNVLSMKVPENEISHVSNDNDEVIVISPEKEGKKSASLTNSVDLDAKPFLPTSSIQKRKLSALFESQQISDLPSSEQKSSENFQQVPVIAEVCMADRSNKTNGDAQINEVSSTEADQIENSESLLHTNNEHSDHTYHTNNVASKCEILKSEMAAMKKEMERLRGTQSEIFKMYKSAVKENNKRLNKEYIEKEKLKDDVQNCEAKAKDEVKKEIMKKIEEDLVCNICTEILIKPTVLECSHTFCEFCITEWKRKKSECPNCRQKFKTMTRVLTLEHFIDRTLETLTPEQRDKRNEVIKERSVGKKQAQNSPKGTCRHYADPRRSSRRNRRRRRLYPAHLTSNPTQPSSTSSLVQPTTSNPIYQANGISTRRNLLLPIQLPLVSIPHLINSTNFRVPEVTISDDEMDSVNIFLS